MCLVLYDPAKDLLAMHRDESFERPFTDFGDHWVDLPSGGTWAGYSKTQDVFWLVVNQPGTYKQKGSSRGRVILNLLNAAEASETSRIISEYRGSGCYFIRAEKIAATLFAVSGEGEVEKRRYGPERLVFTPHGVVPGIDHARAAGLFKSKSLDPKSFFQTALVPRNDEGYGTVHSFWVQDAFSEARRFFTKDHRP